MNGEPWVTATEAADAWLAVDDELGRLLGHTMGQGDAVSQPMHVLAQFLTQRADFLAPVSTGGDEG